MMNDAFDLRMMETHIEVHKFRAGAIVIATFLSLMLQAVVPVYIPKFAVLDLPLLVTIYFGLSRRNPSTGLLTYEDVRQSFSHRDFDQLRVHTPEAFGVFLCNWRG